MNEFVYKKLMQWLYVAVYLLCLFADLRYLIKWTRVGEFEDAFALFIILMIFHLVFPILAIVWKKRGSAARGSVLLLFILGGFAFMSVMTANTMADYIYKSRYGTYDKTLDDFKAGATLNVTSESLEEGIWSDGITNTGVGSNLSPQLSFDEVPGASYYVIYMVDESANYWVHWYAEVTENELKEGACPGRYIGPYPPEDSGDHLYTIVVYALEDKPDFNYNGEFPVFDAPWFDPFELWAGFLNVKDSSNDPVIYGNVLAYGYVSGTYSG